MKDERKLKCTDCRGSLDLLVSFDGCDRDSIKGGGSGYNYEITLQCDECGRIYPIGRLNNEFAFCENIKQRRPYGRMEAPQEEENV
ncbi:MAG: Trm112 family protein [Oscillospiraceae bacterium]|jgi:ribosomal protein L33|nr:Trm112 family protein [Oscillospiraceae bacterium]